MTRATMRSTLRKAKQSGISAEDSWATIRQGRLDAAKEQGWGRAELGMTLADDERDLVAVYGKRATAFLRATKATA